MLGFLGIRRTSGSTDTLEVSNVMVCIRNCIAWIMDGTAIKTMPVVVKTSLRSGSSHFTVPQIPPKKTSIRLAIRKKDT